MVGSSSSFCIRSLMISLVHLAQQWKDVSVLDLGEEFQRAAIRGRRKMGVEDGGGVEDGFSYVFPCSLSESIPFEKSVPQSITHHSFSDNFEDSRRFLHTCSQRRYFSRLLLRTRPSCTTNSVPGSSSPLFKCQERLRFCPSDVSEPSGAYGSA